MGIQFRRAILGAVAAVALTLPAASYADEDVVSSAKAAVAASTSASGAWNGPTSAPKPQAGKHIAYISCDQNIVICHDWGAGVAEAGAKIGWKVTVIDGRGSPVSWGQAFDQAIALKVDGIVTSTDVKAMASHIKEANDRHIPVISFHGTASPGPAAEDGIFYNISLDPRAMGRAQADLAIALSDGKARVVLDTDCEYAIACAKTDGAKTELEKCKTCTVLEVSNSPLSEGAQREPQLITAWVQKYKLPLYVISISDTSVGREIPALRTGGVAPKDAVLIGADGEPEAYQRIRAGGQYQVATVAESALLDGYQAIDEFNRAFNKQPPSGFVARPHLVTHDDVDSQGGDKNLYIPADHFQDKYLAIWGKN